MDVTGVVAQTVGLRAAVKVSALLTAAFRALEDRVPDVKRALEHLGQPGMEAPLQMGLESSPRQVWVCVAEDAAAGSPPAEGTEAGVGASVSVAEWGTGMGPPPADGVAPDDAPPAGRRLVEATQAVRLWQGGTIEVCSSATVRRLPAFSHIADLGTGLLAALRPQVAPQAVRRSVTEQFPNMLRYLEDVFDFSEAQHHVDIPGHGPVAIDRFSTARPIDGHGGQYEEVQLRLSVNGPRLREIWGDLSTDLGKRLPFSADFSCFVSDGAEDPLPPDPRMRTKLLRLHWNAALQYLELNAWKRGGDLVWLRCDPVTGENGPALLPSGEPRLFRFRDCCASGERLVVEMRSQGRLADGIALPQLRFDVACLEAAAEWGVTREVRVTCAHVEDTWSQHSASWVVDLAQAVEHARRSWACAVRHDEPRADPAGGSAVTWEMTGGFPTWIRRFLGVDQQRAVAGVVEGLNPVAIGVDLFRNLRHFCAAARADLARCVSAAGGGGGA